MFIPKDPTYQEIRRRSLEQWLDEMEGHADMSVRGGVKLCREYLEYLREENRCLQEENALKNTYLRKMARKNRT